MARAFRTWLACLALLAVLVSGAFAPATSPTPALDGGGALVAAVVADDDEEDGITYEEHDDDDERERGRRDGRDNIVRVRNHTDNRLRIRGNIQLNRIRGPEVEPVNLALAYNSCTDCQSIAVALQLNLISRTADRVEPHNRSEALNVECLRCAAIARALQYVISVDDPRDVPREVRELIREMDRELREIHSDRRIGLREADERINAVIAQFTALAESLDEQRAEDVQDAGTPGPTPATPTVTPGTMTPAATAAPPTAGPTPSAEPTLPAGATPLPTAEATPAPLPTATGPS
jgi:hypothetical protein